MEFKTGKRFGWFSKMLVFLCAMLLPLAPTLKKEVVAQEKEIKSQPHYPQIVKTVPAMNATGVEAGNTTLRIEFDRKMSDGMSVTGDLSLLPEVIQGKQPHWENARTLLIPVKLEKNKFYRLGINSKSNQNFKSADGVSVPPAVLCFVTEGASDKKKAMVETPTVVKFDPANGAENVAVSVDSLSVTFSKAMNGDMSWVGGGPNFPKIPDGEKATWSKDGKTCHLPVALETGKSYQIGINNLNYNGFQSKAGVPVSPVIYRFSTKK